MQGPCKDAGNCNDHSLAMIKEVKGKAMGQCHSSTDANSLSGTLTSLPPTLSISNQSSECLSEKISKVNISYSPRVRSPRERSFLVSKEIIPPPQSPDVGSRPRQMSLSKNEFKESIAIDVIDIISKLPLVGINEDIPTIVHRTADKLDETSVIANTHGTPEECAEKEMTENEMIESIPNSASKEDTKELKMLLRNAQRVYFLVYFIIFICANPFFNQQQQQVPSTVVSNVDTPTSSSTVDKKNRSVDAARLDNFFHQEVSASLLLPAAKQLLLQTSKGVMKLKQHVSEEHLLTVISAELNAMENTILI